MSKAFCKICLHHKAFYEIMKQKRERGRETEGDRESSVFPKRVGQQVFGFKNDFKVKLQQCTPKSILPQVWKYD